VKNKDDYIKFRVSKEQKTFFKQASEELNISMTELFIVGTEQLVKRKLEVLRNKDIIEQRATQTDNKLQCLKQKLLNKRK
jgi:hypothetical protein